MIFTTQDLLNIKTSLDRYEGNLLKAIIEYLHQDKFLNTLNRMTWPEINNIINQVKEQVEGL